MDTPFLNSSGLPKMPAFLETLRLQVDMPHNKDTEYRFSHNIRRCRHALIQQRILASICSQYTTTQTQSCSTGVDGCDPSLTYSSVILLTSEE